MKVEEVVRFSATTAYRRTRVSCLHCPLMVDVEWMDVTKPIDFLRLIQMTADNWPQGW